MAASRQIHIWLGGLGEIIQHGVRNPTIDTYRFRFEFTHFSFSDGAYHHSSAAKMGLKRMSPSACQCNHVHDTSRSSAFENDRQALLMTAWFDFVPCHPAANMYSTTLLDIVHVVHHGKARISKLLKSIMRFFRMDHHRHAASGGLRRSQLEPPSTTTTT
jgi:hypothetical protein